MSPEARDLIRAVLESPERAAEIPAESVPGLLAQLASVQAILLARLVVEGPYNGNGKSGPPNGDRNLSVMEAAGRLGVKPGYLYRHAGSLPFTVRIGRRLLFSAEGLERWNRRRQGK